MRTVHSSLLVFPPGKQHISERLSALLFVLNINYSAILTAQIVGDVEKKYFLVTTGSFLRSENGSHSCSCKIFQSNRKCTTSLSFQSQYVKTELIRFCNLKKNEIFQKTPYCSKRGLFLNPFERSVFCHFYNLG